jgi:TolA-binding protein
MTRFYVLCSILLLFGAATAQVANAPTNPQRAVSYASSSEVSALLAQLESTAQTTSTAISRLRISKWKTDSGTRQQEQANAESIQRNLQSALPGLISAVRSNPDDVAASFRLFRNLDALYDVMSNVTESAGAFGPREDYQSLNACFDNLDRARRSFADRLEGLASTQQNELAQLRNQVRTLQAANPSGPPKKIIVDDNEPPKKAGHKKKTGAKPKPAAPTPSASNPPSR